MTEEVKRLTPTTDTLRELYFKSGNRCAFTNCQRFLLNASGKFVGQLCHIEAAETGGQRFNPKQSNEDRRAFSNLMFMCYEHHVETNDVGKYTTQILQKMKADHERRFSEMLDGIVGNISDATERQELVPPKNLRRMGRVLNWCVDEEQLAGLLEALVPHLEALAQLPNPTREFFYILVRRSSRVHGRKVAEAIASMHDVLAATGVTAANANGFISILSRLGFTCEAEPDDFGVAQVGIQIFADGWHLWSELKEVCAAEGIDLALLIVGLDFSLLDEDVDQGVPK